MRRGWLYCVIGCVLFWSIQKSQAMGECDPNEPACVQYHSKFFASEKKEHQEWTPQIEGNSAEVLKNKLNQLQRLFDGAVENFNRNTGLTEVSRDWIARRCLHQPEFFKTERHFLECAKKGLKLDSPISPQQQLALQDLLTLREIRARQGMLRRTFDQTPSLQKGINPSEAFDEAFEKMKTRLTQSRSPRNPHCMPRNANLLESHLEACLSGCVDPLSIPDAGASCHKLKALGIEEVAGKELIRAMSFQDGQSLLAVTRIKAAEKLLKGYALLTGHPLKPGEIPSSCQSLGGTDGQGLSLLQPSVRAEDSILGQKEKEFKEASQTLHELKKVQSESCATASSARSCTRALDTRQTICVDDPIETQKCHIATQVLEQQFQAHPNLIPHHPKIPLSTQENFSMVEAIQAQPSETLQILKQSEKYKIQEALHEICTADWKALLNHPLGNASADDATQAGVAGDWAKKCLDQQKQGITPDLIQDLPAVCLTAAPLALFVPTAGIPMSLACTGAGILMKASLIENDAHLSTSVLTCAGITPEVCGSEEFRKLQKEINETVDSILADLVMEGAAPVAGPSIAKTLSKSSTQLKRLFSALRRLKAETKSVAESKAILAELQAIRNLEEAAPETQGFKEIVESIESFFKQTPSGDVATTTPLRSGLANVNLDYHPSPTRPPLVGLELNDPVRVKRSDGSSSVGKILELLPDGHIKVGLNTPQGRATKTIWPKDLAWTEGTTVSWVSPSGKRVPAVVKWHEPGQPVMIEYFERGKSQTRNVPAEDFSLQAPLTRLKTKQIYTAKSGSQIVIDPNSPLLREQVNRALSALQSRTGLVPGDSAILKDSKKRELLYKTWLEEIVPLFEDKNKRIPAIYGSIRDELTRREGGTIDLGKILKGQGAVCRELTMLGHLVFGEYGIESKMISANLFTRDGKKIGRHAWLEMEGGSRFLDHNFKRDFVEPSQYPLYQTEIKSDFLSH